MGGVLILIRTIFRCFIMVRFIKSIYLVLIFICASFLDYSDFMMIIKKLNLIIHAGVSFKFKIIIQIIIAVLGILILTNFADHSDLKNLYFPFFKNLFINLGWFFIPFSAYFYNCRII